jgi:hypothetical protein
MLVQLQILQDKVDAVARCCRGRRRLETDRFIFHPGNACRLFGLRFGQKVGLEPAYVGVPRAPCQRVHVQAHEQITLRGAVGAAVTQSDQGIRRASHLHCHALPLELLCQEQTDRECDFLLTGATREKYARIPRIYPAVARVYRHEVPRP